MESVWDYPRPPRLEAAPQRLEVVFGGVTIAATTDGYRVLETSHPPVYYFPAKDVHLSALKSSEGRSWCEYKGLASYWSVEVNGKMADRAAWSYLHPAEPYSALASFYAFYASKMDTCRVGDMLARPQHGDFYGGWITPNLVGPFKGPPGTGRW